MPARQQGFCVERVENRDRQPEKEKVREMKSIHLFAVLILIHVLALTGVTQAIFNAVIEGQVVDDKGSPIANAGVVFEISEVPGVKPCFADEYYLSTGTDGKFSIKEHCSVSSRTSLVFTEAAMSTTTAAFPIYAPFWKALRDSDPRFAGHAVKLSGDQKIDLGAIPVQVWYYQIELFISDRKGRPFYRSEDDWNRFTLIVRNEHGTAVGESGLSIADVKSKVRVDRGSVRLALPEGRWSLELLKSLNDFGVDGRTRRYLAKGTVSIKKGDPNAYTRLTVR